MVRLRGRMGSLLAGVCLTVFTLSGQASFAQTLQEAMAAAYATNPALKAERARYQATNQGIWTARSEFLPRVTGTYLATHEATQNDRLRTGDRRFSHELNLAINQTLFQGFAGVNRLNQAHEEASAGRSQLIGAEQTLLFNTADAYLRVVRDRTILARLRSYTNVVQREVNATRTRYKSGDATRTDIEQALARLAEAQGNSDQAAGDLEATEALYERLTGQKAGKIGWPSIPDSIDPKGLDEAIAIAMQNNPNIRAAIADARAARYAAKASIGDLLPRVSLESSWDNGYSHKLDNHEEEEFRFGLRVTAPLFAGGRNVASVKRARYSADQAAYELDDTQQTVRENVIRAINQRKASRLRAQAGKRAIDASSRAVKGLQIEFQSGQRTLLDVLDGERELLLNQIDHVRARYDARLADFFLLASVGRLAPRHFSIVEERPPVVARLIPEFTTWDLRLGSSQTETIQLDVPSENEAVSTGTHGGEPKKLDWTSWVFRKGS